MNSVYLTDTELILLDGKCSEKVQKRVNLAKDRLSLQSILTNIKPEYSSFIADVVNEAKTEKKLIYKSKYIHRCGVCKKSAGYAKYTRSTGYHRKGQENFDKPLIMDGIELAERFVVFKDTAILGCCYDCFKEIKPFLVQELKSVEAELPEALMGVKSKYKKCEIYSCTICNWTGSESQMGFVNAVFEGKYKGKCPQCSAKNEFFSTKIKGTQKYVIELN